MSTEPAFYTPGYVWPKRLMILLGVLIFAVGLWPLRTPLWLMAFGTRATAEAVDVIKTKPGLPDQVLRSDAQVRAAQEAHDRSYVFWNEFRFETHDGRTCLVRAPAGSLLKPLYPLLDEDGLPTTSTVWYDPARPEIATFPGIISVWFAPGALLLAGFLAMLIGAVLLYWADKPIPLPHLREKDGEA
ncbi:MAG TPA: hypothetical protein VHY09_07540 [Candidatus Methylacidiphilales bacterium]|jgi:hypothetical protein|nr:hypothetical protein [Candidatus Methylacidiphilales bacterium]